MPIANNFPNASAETIYAEAVDRYNIPTITEKKIGAYVSGNLFPTSWTEVTAGTHYTASDGSILTATSYMTRNSSCYAYYALDNNTSTYWEAQWESGYGTHYLTLELPESRKISEFSIATMMGTTPKVDSITLQGSMGGSSFTTLGSMSNVEDGVTETITVASPVSYKFYRIGVYGNPDYGWGIREFKTTKYWDDEGGREYTYHLTLPFAGLQAEQIIKLKGKSYGSVTSFASPYLDINGLGAKKINGTITSGKRYTLVYTGSQWNILQTF